MSQHVPEDLLVAFVKGEMGEQLAVHIAQHLDLCPACATRAATLEPLAPTLAAVTDPVPPPGLSESILAAARLPVRSSARVEVVVGLMLLGAAALAALTLADPLALVVRLGVLTEVLASLGSRLSASVWSSTSVLVFSMVTGISSLAAVARVAAPEWRVW